MKNFMLLDCTLREAPLEDLMWGKLSVNRLLHGLEDAGVDIIEVGFLKNNPYREGSTSFKHVEEITPYIKNKRADVLYVALVDYGRYDLENLTNYDGKSIDAIRVCFKHHEINDVLDYAELIRNKGYKVCIQHVDTMGYRDEEIKEFIKRVNEFKPFSYSIVDTFGAMYMKDVLHYINLVKDELDKEIWLGLHVHNNLMLADSNAQCFVDMLLEKRKIIVDSSLYGCGRGAGNAHTEQLALYMNKNHAARYDINVILDLIDTVMTSVADKTSWGYSIPYFVSGMYNAHTFNVNQLLKRHNLRSKDLCGIIGMLTDTQKKEYDYALLEQLYVKYFEKEIDDSEVLKELSGSLIGKKILLLGPGKSVKENYNNICNFIQEKNPIVIGVNNVIEGYKLDYIFYSGAVRYHDLQYQGYKQSGSPKMIVTSNIKTDADKEEYIVNYSSLIKTGWKNFDSSIILLMRLLIMCGIQEMFFAGLDGYQNFGSAFYSNELETNLDKQARAEHTRDNISMMRDIRTNTPNLKVSFLTESVYEEVFQEC